MTACSPGDPKSRKLREDCKDKAKEALKAQRWTQVGLGERADIYAASTISNFFCCKPVLRANFYRFCDLLSLDPEEVGERPSATLPPEQQADANCNIPRTDEIGWYQRLLENHSLIRIQAPVQFGKTLLMSRMLNHAKQQGHLSLYVTLNGIDSNSFGDAPTFFRNFICEIGNELEDSYPNRLMLIDEYDKYVKQLGSIKAVVKYLGYFQKSIKQPFTLGINKLDRLLDDPQNANTAAGFLRLLRLIHEISKTDENWSQFRLILAYSTPRFEDFVPLLNSESPFNVGSSLFVCEFNSDEVAELAMKKGLVLNEQQVQLLMQPIGGIPSLVQLTLNTLRERGVPLLEDSTAISSIYRDHLEVLDSYLRSRDLTSTIKQIATNEIEATMLDDRKLSLLCRRGLIIKMNDGQILPRCELYRHFFAKE